jgi:hypothetical protein
MRAIRIVVLALLAAIFLGISGSDANALDISEDFQPPPAEVGTRTSSSSSTKRDASRIGSRT